jgi:hypothetical protein
MSCILDMCFHSYLHTRAYLNVLLRIFEGFASAAGPLTSPTAQQIGGPVDCCSVEAVEDLSFVARLVCTDSLVGCLVGWLVG